MDESGQDRIGAGGQEPVPITGGGRDRVCRERAQEVLASSAAEGIFYANAAWGRDFAGVRAHDPDAFFILDVRDRSDYCRGHIEGAVHMDFRRWASPGNLAMLPRDRKIIVVCANGCLSSQVSSGLRLLGFDAAIIRTGMNGWAGTARTGETLAMIEAARYPVSRTSSGPCASVTDSPEPVPLPEHAYEIIAGRLDRLFRDTPVDGAFAFNVIDPAELHERLESSVAGEYFLLDVREEDEFEGIGHIEGATRMDFRAVAVPGNLARLPRDRKIITVCYTGNMAAQLVTVLRLLHHDAAVLNLGMAGWTMTPATRSYLNDIRESDNPVAVMDEADCRRSRRS